MNIPSYTGKGSPNCASTDPEVFFPDSDLPDYEQHVVMAAKVCRGCPYLKECLDYAVENNEIGIWGGTTREQRHSIRRKARKSGSVSLGGTITVRGYAKVGP